MPKALRIFPFPYLILCAVLAGSMASLVAADVPGKRSADEIERLIQEAEKTPPAWLAEIPADYPKTLDLSWPDKSEGGWDAKKNIGQYLWSTVRPDPERWRGAVRLLSDLVAQGGDPLRVNKAKRERARYYFLLGEYAHAAAGLRNSGKPSLELAHTYWRLGCRDLAVAELKRVGSGGEYCSAVLLWAEMEDYKTAQEIAAQAGSSMADGALNALGDSYRRQGDWAKAQDAYARAAALTQGSRRLEIQKRRAASAAEAMSAASRLDFANLPDGTRRARAEGYKGPVEVEVTVKEGDIAAVRVLGLREDQPLDALSVMPERLVAAGSPRGVDVVTGATVTSDAVLHAAVLAAAGVGTEKEEKKKPAKEKASGYKNGQFTGSAKGYIAQVAVRVTINNGKISAVAITSTREDRPKTALTVIPQRIVAKGGTEGVDVVSGASITSRAILKATQAALEQAKR